MAILTKYWNQSSSSASSQTHESFEDETFQYYLLTLGPLWEDSHTETSLRKLVHLFPFTDVPSRSINPVESLHIFKLGFLFGGRDLFHYPEALFTSNVCVKRQELGPWQQRFQGSGINPSLPLYVLHYPSEVRTARQSVSLWFRLNGLTVVN